MPPIGPPYHLISIDGDLPWDTLQGGDVVWDYAWITLDPSNGVTYTAVAPADAPDLAAYPGADRVLRSVLDNDSEYIVHRYYDQVDQAISELGSVGPVLSYVFDNPQLMYPMPLELGDTLEGDYCFWSDGLGVQYHFCGSNYTTFDAQGTLIMPYGTFTDVRHLTLWESSIETTGGGAADSSYSVRQQWFVPGVPFPALDVNIYIDAIGQWWPSATVMDESTLTGLLEHTAGPIWSMQPNPAADIVTLHHGADLEGMAEVFAPDGRCVRNVAVRPGSIQEVIDLTGLSDGVYLVALTSDGLRSTQRVVKAR